MKNYPKYKCEFCKEFTQLKFNPLTNKEKFDHWRCPRCRKRKRKLKTFSKNYGNRFTKTKQNN